MRGFAVLVFLLAGSLQAHQQPLGGVRPFVVDGELVGGSSTWGLVLVDDEGRALRVCEEAARQNVAFHLRLDDGRVLLGGAGGLFISDDGGCSLGLVLGDVLGHEIASVALGAAGLFVSSGRPGFPNGVFVGVDDDTRFVATGLNGTASPLWDLVADPVGPGLFVSGDDLDLEQPLLLASTDGGASWTAPTFDLGAYASLKVLAVDDGAVLVAALLPDGRGLLLRAAADLRRADLVATFDLPVTHAAVLPGVNGPLLAVVVEPGQLYVRAPGGQSLAVVADVQASCVWSLDGALWACGSTTGDLAGVHFAQSLDGLAWTPALLDADIRERSCAQGSDGAEACAAYVDAGSPLDAGTAVEDAGFGFVDAGFADAGFVDPADPGSAADVAPTPSSCGTGPGPPLVWVLALACFKKRRAC